MTYSVHQHWDPLKTCIVGRSYNPEFYSFIKNSKARSVMERIAEETEEDYQKLIILLKSFGVEIIRPSVSDDYTKYIDYRNKIMPPPMTPRDYCAMIGDTFYFGIIRLEHKWDMIRGTDWPEKPPSNLNDLSPSVYNEIKENYPGFIDLVNKHSLNNHDRINYHPSCFDSMLDTLRPNIKHLVMDSGYNSAMTSRIGKDLYFGTYNSKDILEMMQAKLNVDFPDYRCHVVDTQGHTDSTFCPVKPGLIVSLKDIPTYKDTFPGWEVVYLPNQSWDAVQSFNDLKNKNRGKWWVPGEELNDDFTDFVEQWLGHWVGYVEETVFDVNMLVIDEKNVICNNYNEKVFEAFQRHGITPHICNFRHRYFWDGGLHCITSDLNRTGDQKDYFPERG